MSKTKIKKTENQITTIEEKLYIVDFCPDIDSHIKVNQDLCLICKNKDCTKFCPSNVFAWSDVDEQIIITYENCLECGACRMGCPYEAIEYKHPKAGFGLVSN